MEVHLLKRRIEKVLRIYNKYRSPEVKGRLVNVNDRESDFTVAFEGSFCRTCGLYDYFEDLIYEMLDEIGIKASIVGVEQDPESEVYRVRYRAER